MDPKRLLILLAAFVVGLGGCAQPAPAPVPAPLEIVVYYYIGAFDLNLKNTPDQSGANGAAVRLNERVQSLQRRGAWFLVRTAGGQEGWANERDLELEPVSRLYVRRWGARLRQAPQDQAETLERLRANDEVKLLEQNRPDWLRVTVERTRDTGWLKTSDLSLDRVSMPRPVRRRRPTPPAPKPLLEIPPAPAEAAPPPSETVPHPSQTAPLPPETLPPPPPPLRSVPQKVQPEMFEPF